MILIFLGQSARHRGCLLFHSAFRPGHADDSETGRKLAQQHGAGRAGAGVFAAD